MRGRPQGELFYYKQGRDTEGGSPSVLVQKGAKRVSYRNNPPSGYASRASRAIKYGRLIFGLKIEDYFLIRRDCGNSLV